MKVERLNQSELIYELRIRGVEPTGNVEQLRKLLRSSLKVEKREFPSNPYTFEEDVKVEPSDYDYYKEEYVGFSDPYETSDLDKDPTYLPEKSKSPTHEFSSDEENIRAMSIGVGYCQMNEYFSSIDLPCMSNSIFCKYFQDVSKHIQKIPWKSFKEAADQEARITKDEDCADENGTPIITVIVDGAWSKRSYRKNYNSLSRVLEITEMSTIWKKEVNRLLADELRYELESRGFKTGSVDTMRRSLRSVLNLEKTGQLSAITYNIAFTVDIQQISENSKQLSEALQVFDGNCTTSTFRRISTLMSHTLYRLDRCQPNTEDERVAKNEHLVAITGIKASFESVVRKYKRASLRDESLVLAVEEGVDTSSESDEQESSEVFQSTRNCYILGILSRNRL
ncbi:hypothetical protein RN001_012331 [Aquatica leii]|uniref:Mutator-like transposase domain-containing protein n=1 Tax=Aquatica leii TaxID=1421715 RepID=A0AAN7SF38_9COLE|nr:hypothetical protein RN001_012331 [Aquatica leii]